MRNCLRRWTKPSPTRKSALKKVLLIPPDFTRFHSGAGKITAHLYDVLKDACRVDILPALGTHVAMTPEELRAMFGPGIPQDRFLVHNWRTDVVKLGEVPADFVREVSEGLVTDAIPVEVNRLLLDASYDLIVSIGQVVPHEVVGMANYGKNIFVGCGGSAMIHASHMLGAFYGMERIMGRDFSPVRKVFDYAQAHFLAQIPLCYVLTVTTAPEGQVRMHGLFIGRERSCFEKAVALSQQKNLTFVDKPIRKVVVLLDGQEFKSTWLGNKAVYRTRMAHCGRRRAGRAGAGRGAVRRGRRHRRTHPQIRLLRPRARAGAGADARGPARQPVCRGAPHSRLFGRPLHHYLLSPQADGSRGARRVLPVYAL